jgi:hypothetical protein
MRSYTEHPISIHFPQYRPVSSSMSGFFSNLFSTAPTSLSDHDAAQQALQAFYNEAASLTGNSMPASFAELEGNVLQKSPAFYDGLGMAINSIVQGGTGFTYANANQAMVQLADTGNGNMPVNYTDFFSVVGQAGANPSMWAAIQFTTEASIVQVATGVQAVGQSIISTGTFLTKYLTPILIVGGGAFLYFYATSLGGGHRSALKGFGEKAKAKYNEAKSAIKQKVGAL